ncbi:MAG: DUF4270 family protein [Bacteroidota bacterium]|nr:DUF4270 family protein [Bacteroidota bacterium]
MKRSDFRIHPTVCIAFGCFLALLTGCTKPETDIGLGLQPASELLNAVTVDTVTVRMATVLEDSLETDRLSTGLIGSMDIPGLTRFTASLATQLRLSATDVNFGENAVADSMYLLLRTTDDFYGRDGLIDLSVQPLLDSLSLDGSLHSNLEPLTTGEEWVSSEVFSLPLAADNVVAVGEDSTVAAFKVPLSVERAQDILDLDPSSLNGNSAWFETLPGLLIRPLPSSIGEGVAALDINSGLSVMRLHYTNSTESAFYDFLISPLSARVNLFNHDFSGGALADLVGNNPLDELPGNEKGYVISAAGSKVRLDFPHLEEFEDEEGNIPTVLKAELVVPIAEVATYKPLPTQDQLFVLLESANGSVVSTPDQNAPIPVGGEKDLARDAYVFNLTSTVQSMMKGDLQGRALYLVSSRAGISVSRVELQGTGTENPTRLELTFGL